MLHNVVRGSVELVTSLTMFLSSTSDLSRMKLLVRIYFQKQIRSSDICNKCCSKLQNMQIKNLMRDIIYTVNCRFLIYYVVVTSDPINK